MVCILIKKIKFWLRNIPVIADNLLRLLLYWKLIPATHTAWWQDMLKCSITLYRCFPLPRGVYCWAKLHLFSALLCVKLNFGVTLYNFTYPISFEETRAFHTFSVPSFYVFSEFILFSEFMLFIVFWHSAKLQSVLGQPSWNNMFCGRQDC